MVSISKLKNILFIFVAILLFNFLFLYNLDDINEYFKIIILLSISVIIAFTIIIYYLLDKYIKELSKISEKETNQKLDLEAKLIEEIDKNITKDLILYQQSRFATIGHISTYLFNEWKQYLNIITVSVGCIKLKQDLNINIATDDINRMNENVIKSANIISDIIYNFNTLSNNSQGINKFIVEDAINNALNIMSVLFKDSHISVKTNLDEDITLIGIRHLLSQVILNILINSLDEFSRTYIVTKKVIKISLTKVNDNVIIQIKDNAGGISDEAMGKIYDPLFSTKNHLSNIGMGLYTCVQILENYFGGYIYNENHVDKDGVGACFTVKIPLVQK